MTQLRLNQITVRTARAGTTGVEATPDGTHVLLDTPGGNFEFTAYEVRRGHLTVPGSNTTPAPLDTRYRYWCAWSPQALQAPSNGRFQIIQGFGYPLPVRFDGHTLVLPNTRNVRVVWFNLTAQTHVVTPAMTPDQAQAAQAMQRMLDRKHSSAVQLFRDLHVELTFENMTPPSGRGYPWYLSGHRTLVNAPAPGDPYTRVSPPPDFTEAAWTPAGALTSTLTVYWVEDFVGMGTVNGEAHPYLHVLGAVYQLANQQFTSPSNGHLFMRRNTLNAGPNSLGHEIAHCLLADPGIGQTGIRSVPGHEALVQAFLGRLRIEGPSSANPPPAAGSRLFGELFQGVHAPSSQTNNLMGTTGGTELLPWQVAVIRASREVGDAP